MNIFQALPSAPSFGELPPTLIGLLIGVVMLAMLAASTITTVIVRALLRDWREDRKETAEQRQETTKVLREIAVHMALTNQTLTLMQTELLKVVIDLVRQVKATDH